ncbi:MAG: hypothetical protein JO287_02155 [Pseudonocardiales bacterium]|nr:hypothetical protein [Pseudonocardiales bacterium]
MSVASPAVAAAARRLAGRELLVLGGVVTAVLLGVAAGYGPHRDELYFLRAGAQPAWGYADQPPLAPLLAHLLDGRLRRLAGRVAGAVGTHGRAGRGAHRADRR